jgi:GAF domain-containing protein
MNEKTEVDEFRATLRESVDAALRYLNARTPHRFTGIFRYERERLQNLYLIDREDPAAQPWPEFDTRESYCAVVQKTGEPFVVGNAPADSRIADHPARDRVISYCGVPIRSSDGRLVASLCHFDYRPIRASELDLDFLVDVAPYIANAIV